MQSGLKGSGDICPGAKALCEKGNQMLVNDNLPPASFDQYLIEPRYSDLSSRSEADPSWDLGPHHLDIPIIAANMDTICGEAMAAKMASLGGLGIIHRYMSVEEYQRIAREWHTSTATAEHPLALSVGTVANDKERIDAFAGPDSNADILCIDIAHGHSAHMERAIKYIKDRGFVGQIIAGNVVSPVATRDLLEWGADIVKAGVGPGGVCSTRIKTGCGYPQLAAIARCAEVGPVIADGGIRSPGDAAKSLAAGAKAVMVGGMLAGTDFVPGWADGTIMEYRGMASKAARSAFGQEPTNAEGICKPICAKDAGSTEEVISDMVEGIRSAMSYTGTRNLISFYYESRLVRVSSVLG